MSLKREIKPFTGDLRQTILDACAEVGGGTVEGYLDKIVREHPETTLAKQALGIKRRLAIHPHASKEGSRPTLLEEIRAGRKR